MPNRRLHSAFLLLLCLGLLAGVPCAQALGIRHGSKDAKRQVEDMETQWRTAVLNRDIPMMDRLLSDDYVGISMSGMVNTKLQQLDRLRSRTVVITRIDLSDVKVKLVGAVAIVTSMANIEGTNDGASMSGIYRYTRVYQRNPTGIWKITNFEATRISPNNRPAQTDTRPARFNSTPGAPSPGTTAVPPSSHFLGYHALPTVAVPLAGASHL